MLALLFLLLVLSTCAAHAPAPEPDSDDVLSDAFVYNLNGVDFEGTLFSPGAAPGELVLFVGDPFTDAAEAETALALELATQGYTVVLIDSFGSFQTLESDPEQLIDHLTRAFRELGSNPAFFDSSRAVVGHGLGGTLAIEAARHGALDVEAVVAISPTSLRVSEDDEMRVRTLIGLYVSHNGPVSSEQIFGFENELRLMNASYEVTRFSTAESDVLNDAVSKERTQALLKTFLSVAFAPDQLEYISEPFNETNINGDDIGFGFIDYKDGKDDLRGFLAYPVSPPTDGPLPFVLVAPDWDGLDYYEMWRTKLLAQWGYVALAVDIYGTSIEQGATLPVPDRQRLVGRYSGRAFVSRLTAAIDAAADSDLVEVDAGRIAMMGYCFGGSGVLEAAAADIPGLKGVIGFHAGSLIPKTQSNEDCQPVALLVLNGADDPSVPQDSVDEFFEYNTQLDVTWEFTNYGASIHAFTVPTLERTGSFLAYSPFADVLSFASLQDFLEKIFTEPTLYEKCDTE